jgi:hypothetical protein
LPIPGQLPRPLTGPRASCSPASARAARHGWGGRRWTRTWQCNQAGSGQSPYEGSWMGRAARRRCTAAWRPSQAHDATHLPYLLCLDRFSSPERWLVGGRGISDVENSIKGCLAVSFRDHRVYLPIKGSHSIQSFFFLSFRPVHDFT